MVLAVGDHPNLVRTIGVIEDGKDTLVVLEPADGKYVTEDAEPARAHLTSAARQHGSSDGRGKAAAACRTSCPG